MRLQATYFDGRSAQAYPVQLHALPGLVWVVGEGGLSRREPLAEVRISEQLGRAPRLIHFRDGAHLEISDHAALAEWLEAVGYRERSVDLLQRSGAVALLALVAVVLAGVVGYRWGLPELARILAQRVPSAITQQLADGTLEVMDRVMLAPSQLPAARRARLESGLRRLDPQQQGRLVFRSGAGLGPNAMALPDGTIVLLDELVTLAASDEEVLAVLAHELAHVEARHALRQMIEAGAIGALVAWWVGDYGALITAAPAAILQARHSRALEVEADALAAVRLRAAGISPARLADLLEKLDSVQARAMQQERESPTWLDYLSSHPATRDRIAALRAAK